MSDPTPPPAAANYPPGQGPLRVAFKSYDSKMASREKLFRAATEFASQIGRDQLITITHSEDRDNIAVCIWYWTTEVEKFEAKGAAKVVEKKPPAEPVKYVGSGEGLGQRLMPKQEPVRRTSPETMVPSKEEGGEARGGSP